jgi:hypothetical protein
MLDATIKRSRVIDRMPLANRPVGLSTHQIPDAAEEFARES